MKREAAVAEAKQLIEGVESSIGGKWETFDTGEDICLRGHGMSEAFLRIGRGVPTDNQHAVLLRVREQWLDAGLHATQNSLSAGDDVTLTRLQYPEGGMGEDGFSLDFSISTRATTLEVLSRCYEGARHEPDE